MTVGRHIVFVGGTSEPGGLHVHTADIAGACAAAGVRASVLCTSVDHFSALLEGRGVGFELVPPSDLAAGWSKAVCARLIRMGATDAVLCRGHLGETPIAHLFALRRVCPRLYTIEHRPAENRFSRAWMRVAKGASMRYAVRRAIVVDDEIGREARDMLRLGEDQVAVCRNWYDPAFRPPSAAEKRAARAALGLPGRGTVIGYHGRLAPEKRIDMLLAAYALLDEETRAAAPLVLIGEGWKRGELERQAQALGIASQVTFTGWFPDVVRAVSAIDIAILPSLVEGFPLSLMEAMASGALCLAHPMSSTLDLLGEGGSRGILWPLETAFSIKAALECALRLPADARRRLAKEAAQWIAVHHARDTRIADVLAALDIEAPLPPDALDVRRKLEFAQA